MNPTRMEQNDLPNSNVPFGREVIQHNDALWRELEVLRRSEAALRDLIETSTISLHSVGPDGTILWANQAELDLLGYTREAYVGRNITEFHADQPVISDILACLSRGETLRDYPARLRHRDGSIRQVLINSSALFENGKFVHTRCFTRDVTAMQTEQEAALLLSAIVDSSDDAIISKDLNGIITTWNTSAERMFGYTAEEIVGQPVLRLIPEDRWAEEPDILARLQRGERVDHFETVRRRKDGTLLDISLTISPVRGRQGRIIGASKIARDITARKRAEEAIRSLNTQLKADLSAMTRLQQLSTCLVREGTSYELLDEILDAGVSITGADMGLLQVLDKDGGLTIIAQRGFEAPFLAFFGASHDGRAACDGALRNRERMIIEDVANSAVFDTASREVMLAAEARAVQSTPLVGRLGEVLGVFSTHYRTPCKPVDRDIRLIDLLARQAADLIDRKRAEETRGQLSAIVEASADAIYVYDFEGKILTWNKAAEELYGLNSQEIIGRHISTIAPPDRRAELQGIIEAGRGEAKIIKDLETTRMRRDGSVFPALLTISPIRDESGKAVALSVIARDVTERKRAENELRRANEDFEQFAYSASHDLQEPLRTIRIYSELLADRLGPMVEGESAEFLDFLRNASTRMQLLVRDLLDYTQVARLPAPLEEVDANESLAAALENLGGAIAESGATVTYDKLPMLRAHGTHLRQLFQNLIGNAIKYRSETREPAVHIGAGHNDGYWIFKVRDNGIGIEPEFREQIFGLFSRLHNADRYAGTGIGLAICQRIVERYHGRIWVESEPGCGSEFHFTFPS